MDKLTKILMLTSLVFCGSNLTAQQVTTYAGVGTVGYSGDTELASGAELNSPYGIVTDSDGNVYFSDQQNGAIRRIDKDSQIITTVVDSDHEGAIILPNELSIDDDVIYFIDNNISTANILKFSVDDYTVSLVGGIPSDYIGFCVQGDSIFLTNYSEHIIGLFIISTGSISTFSGVYGSSGSLDGSTAIALYNSPYAIDFDMDGNLIVGEFTGGSIRKIDLSTLTVSTLVTGLSGVEGLTVADDGVIYIVEQSNNQIKKIDNSGSLVLVAGSGNTGSVNGAFDVASFDAPVKIAVDDNNNIYVSDNNNNMIRHVGCKYAGPATLETSTNTVEFCSNSSGEWYIYIDSDFSELNENENWVWYDVDCGEQQSYVGDTLIVKPTQTTTYYVRGEGGCIQNGMCQEITLVQTNCDTVISDTEYTAFSPNNDGVNDVWIINGIELYFENKVYIYNRWGDLITEIENYNNLENVWDGKNSESTLVSPGTYFYIVEDGNDNKLKSGWIQVIR